MRSTNKRTSIPRESSYTKVFLKDWERLSASGRFNMGKLKDVMLRLISNQDPLPPELLDHPLKGNWQGHRECHIGGDFLLVYLLNPQKNRVMFSRCGTHADIFE